MVDGVTVLSRVYIADGFFSRLIGWMFRKPPGMHEGLLLSPCRQIHTMWMRADLDVIYLAKDGTILAIAEGMKPWRIGRPVADADRVLETKAGFAKAMYLTNHQRITIKSKG